MRDKSPCGMRWFIVYDRPKNLKGFTKPRLDLDRTRTHPHAVAIVVELTKSVVDFPSPHPRKAHVQARLRVFECIHYLIQILR